MKEEEEKSFIMVDPQMGSARKKKFHTRRRSFISRSQEKLIFSLPNVILKKMNGEPDRKRIPLCILIAAPPFFFLVHLKKPNLHS